MTGAISSFLAYFRKQINKGQERSIKAKKNILGSLVIKGLSIAISFVLVPLTINYVNSSNYGIWLAVSSIVGWFSFFDIGLTQGLRNKFAEAKARDDDESAQVYVSTTYAILGIIFTAVWFVYLAVSQFLDWSAILKVAPEMKGEVTILALIIFTYFCLQFVLRIITTIVIADQQPAKSSLIDLLGQVATLVFIGILVITTEGSLIYLALALCVSPLLVLLAANIFLFKGVYKKYKPALSKIDFSNYKGLFNLGLTFFVIQIAGIIQYQTANIIIARNFGTLEVTSYNIVYKYFQMINMVFTIFLTPFWSASTEAYEKGDYQWIKNGIKKYNRLNILVFGLSILMLLFSDTFYDLWLGEGTVEIDFLLSFWGFIFFNIAMFGGKYMSFLNGISALRIQFWSSMASPLIYIGIVYVLISYFEMGVYAIFVAAVLANYNAFILAPLQYYMIIVKGKRGIWIK
jgi:O-antigen/teichoic acid export membrane protein